LLSSYGEYREFTGLSLTRNVTTNRLFGTILELPVHPEDVGHAIGPHGRIDNTIRTIFGAAGVKQCDPLPVTQLINACDRHHSSLCSFLL
jgi:predicted RNA-binding protein YlqC (UPF0109 family)